MIKYIIFDIETTGLSPLEKIKYIEERIVHKIVAIAALNIENNIKEVFIGEDEKVMLTNFFNFIKEGNYFIGFNTDFDFNFIKVRALVNNVKINNNFNENNIIDLRKKLNSNQYAVGRLRDYCKLIGVNSSTENGEHMLEFYEKKEWDKIKEHCLEDIEITKQLFNRCVNCNLLNLEDIKIKKEIIF